MSHRRVVLLAFAAYLLLSAAWSLALPTNGTYDERHHIVKAYATASGHLFAAGPAHDGTNFGDLGFDVPKSLIPGNVDCVRGRGPASCQHPTEDRTVVRTVSAAATYSPVYYLPVGLPLLVWPDHTGVVLARLVSSLLSALVLAAAVGIALRLAGRFLVAALALAVTPMAVNLSGSVNPNGIEIAAGVLLFVSVAALLRGRVTRGVLVAGGLAAVIMLTVRPPLGPILFVIDAAACALVAGRPRVAALARRRDARLVLGGLTLLGVVVTGGWTLLSGGPETAPVAERGIKGDIPAQVLHTRIPFYLHQIVGQFGYGETTMSTKAIYLWYLLVLVVVGPALLWGGWRLRATLVGLGVVSAALLVALDLYFAPRNGWFAHGRYVLPVIAGVLVLSALSGRGPRRWLAATRSRWLPVALVAVAAPIQLYALARVMSRYQNGIGAPFDPLNGVWLPTGGPLLPLLTLAVGLALLVTAVIVAHGDGREPAVMVSDTPDDVSVTPTGHSANEVTKASTTDATSH